MDKIDAAIARLRTGSLMAERYTGKPMVITYSGGKDSDVLLHLARRADIPIEVLYSLTTVDAPETVWHVRDVFRALELDGISAHIEFGKYKGKRVTMWELIVQKGIPPSRLMRYCCSVFKESHNKGRMIATGVRWQESSARAKRAAYEALTPRKEDKILVNDMVALRAVMRLGWEIPNPINAYNANLDNAFPFAVYAAATGTISTVDVTPATPTVAKGSGQQFAASVSGTGGPYSTAVTWGVSGASAVAAGTQISQSGYLTVDAAETNTTLTVTAKSRQTPSVTDTATVTVSGG